MSTKFTFSVSPCGATLELTHNLVTVDTWEDKSQSEKLLAGAGIVDDSEAGKLICKLEGVPIVTLVGATWDSKPNATGMGKCDECKNTPSDQQWTLVSRE